MVIGCPPCRLPVAFRCQDCRRIFVTEEAFFGHSHSSGRNKDTKSRHRKKRSSSKTHHDDKRSEKTSVPGSDERKSKKSSSRHHDVEKRFKTDKRDKSQTRPNPQHPLSSTAHSGVKRSKISSSSSHPHHGGKKSSQITSKTGDQHPSKCFSSMFKLPLHHKLNEKQLPAIQRGESVSGGSLSSHSSSSSVSSIRKTTRPPSRKTIQEEEDALPATLVDLEKDLDLSEDSSDEDDCSSLSMRKEEADKAAGAPNASGCSQPPLTAGIMTRITWGDFTQPFKIPKVNVNHVVLRILVFQKDLVQLIFL